MRGYGPDVDDAPVTVRVAPELVFLLRPRDRPATGTRKSPSFDPSTLPSVEIHRLPVLSKATLSGQLIGLTRLRSKPEK